MAIRHLQKAFGLVVIAIFASACTNPHKVDIELTEDQPAAKTTTLSEAVYDLGLMSEIYETDKIFFMARDIIDNTGSSLATSAEIRRDITEMLKSTLNAFGGNIRYIPYDPDFIINNANTGYSGFNAKAMPDVIVSGGITEFDRGLETRGKNTDLSLEGDVKRETVGLEFSSQNKKSVSSITLDFNLIDFESLAGIPRIQAINNIKVHKGIAEDTIGFSISGNAIGLQGNVKKVQGRHAAIRLLVQASMIQLIGKHLGLPYWRLIPDSEVDPIVINKIKSKYAQMGETDRIIATQKLLILHGYDIPAIGVIDEHTEEAILDYASNVGMEVNALEQDLYVSLYTNVPNTHATLQKLTLLKTLPMADSSEASTLISNDGVLHITTNGTRFKIGDEINMTFSLSAPRYVQVYNLSSNGEVWNLYPGENESVPLLHAGSLISIPAKEANYKLEVTGPTGTDQIVAIASSSPIAVPSNAISDDTLLASHLDGTTASVVREEIIIE